ncbi:MAG TPA: hypothetical protein VN700_18945 [Vicinamibacterales bacterium]|nr:hypothetical protein [Vicinamibacterales bacterium]
MLRWKTEKNWLGFGLVALQGQDGFKPATDLGRETLPALPLVYGAYAFCWLVVIGYVFLLWRRLDRVEKDLKEVSGRVGAARR